MEARTCLICVLAALLAGIAIRPAAAHDHTSHQAATKQRADSAAATREDQQLAAALRENGHCHLTIQLTSGRGGMSLPGCVRITDTESGAVVPLTDLIKREENWFAMPAEANVVVPQSTLKIEAFHGIEFERSVHEVELSSVNKAKVEIALTRFYNAHQRGLRGGNTHLHLMNLTHAEAIRYLQVVPAADGLDLVYLSHLRRIPDERNYISNQIVEDSFAGGSLERLSDGAVLFANGEEHRHNFGQGGEGYGHVMLLDLKKLIRPVSIGPGIMREGTDGIPLRRGIQEARADGATVIWCHNTFGFEDVPNWMAGLLDAQNIFDGGTHGSYEDTFYRYLNLGMKVPFSTGTDWFIYDFSRVYVPVAGELTSKKWLGQLAAGRGFITNGVLLEFQIGDNQIGDTVRLAEPGDVEVRARAVGRNNFQSIELIHNGTVVQTVEAVENDQHYSAELNCSVTIEKSGWLAVRVPLESGTNEFGKPLFAHTSPIYIDVAGQRVFDATIATEMIGEINSNIAIINEKGVFANDAERDAVHRVHQDSIRILERRIQESGGAPIR